MPQAITVLMCKTHHWQFEKASIKFSILCPVKPDLPYPLQPPPVERELPGDYYLLLNPLQGEIIVAPRGKKWQDAESVTVSIHVGTFDMTVRELPILQSEGQVGRGPVCGPVKIQWPTAIYETHIQAGGGIDFSHPLYQFPMLDAGAPEYSTTVNLCFTFILFV